MEEAFARQVCFRQEIEPKNRGDACAHHVSAGALKRMPHLPANAVIGTPRIERDRAGREIVVPTHPYARDVDRYAECGGHGRPYDRPPTRRRRHLASGTRGFSLKHAPARGLRRTEGPKGPPKQMSGECAKAGIRLPAATIRTWIHRKRLASDEHGHVTLRDIVPLLRDRAR
ncbi:hypothetical protein [Bifidobacterium callitrichos]|uniref:Uncharacterized protein n=1 Tax=Bifidobacterium callitrichos DSM 23973 TaxID=1437609 RepID=A0A087A192_9BIFI|nr:hypothetical protein [Bifidobacterium callitrichos]KFI52542.1 hypothetical protein BCAL_1875 [Bifidobacterium callitrichos DSM 23973]